ncbi:hypothetical protein NPS01_24560 [Nocardioides psychrotolerans]|uniref:DUF2877 domain-containing protein n=1 Tax=Nocardioides psychrotolerans TaxID=1005945 RepID=A0A1I3L733_9ACTN|nr:hypothetical protein NPS01_24560 [Nocardioides psychrotolerans]SFI80507.1 Protein of unknown function [Nocardioides psychrotolerans]
MAADGPVRVLHRGRHAIYLDLEGWCVGVVGSAAVAVPCALRLGASDLSWLVSVSVSAPVQVQVRDGILHLDDAPLTIGRLVEVRAPALRLAQLHRSLAASARRHRSLRPEVAELVADVGGRPLEPAAVGRLVGRGDGLTPLGDDLLCGWLALHRAAGMTTPAIDAAVLALLHRTTLLSATLLDCALHGEVLPQFAAYVAALGTPHEPTAAAALAAVGHTSGAGLLHGAHLALTELGASIGAAA